MNQKCKICGKGKKCIAKGLCKKCCVHLHYKKNNKKYNKTAIKWQKEHPKRKKEIDKKWRENNPEKSRESLRKWRKTPRGRILKNISTRGRLYKYKNVIHKFTPEQYLVKIKNIKNICPICFKKIINNKKNKNYYKRRLTMNHEPALDLVKQGHVYKINGVAPMCQSCNSKIKNRFFKINFKKNLKKINKIVMGKP